MAWTEIARRQYECHNSRYVSDLTDAEWSIIEPLIPASKRLGRPRKTNLRELVNALLYIASSDGSWRLLPTDFPPFSTVQKYFYRWRNEGTLSAIGDTLVMAARELADKQPSPTAGVIDSQSVKTTESGGIRGFDAGKKINRRKRHIVVDTLDLMIGLVIHSAGNQDRDSAPGVLKPLSNAGHGCGISLLAAVTQDQSSKAGWKRSGSLHWKSSSGPVTLKVSNYSHEDGLSSAHLHGWDGVADWPRLREDHRFLTRRIARA
ncbi:transposase DDE domain protein [Brucella grignonensis]|uniref:Transposase DDE domain protein n=1 Tax=Brucella grignonensis TaxID=94627 RepID=A0A256FNF2_9HYPH|nr:transposase DDE domain protein [Brucella grignonensis]